MTAVAEYFAPLRDLRLAADTTVYLGVIHRDDGLEGARRRIAAARTALPEFGIASFCGLGNPRVANSTQSTLSVGEALHGSLHDGGTGVDRDLALHHDVAMLEDV